MKIYIVRLTGCKVIQGCFDTREKAQNYQKEFENRENISTQIDMFTLNKTEDRVVEERE